jgi:hypothetical protein
MGNLVGLDGLNRQGKRQIEREIAKDFVQIIPGIINDIRLLALRNELFLEVFKILGVTDEQFKQAYDIAKAKFEKETGKDEA